MIVGAAALLAASAGCDKDEVFVVGGGVLEVEVRNVRAGADDLRITVDSDAEDEPRGKTLLVERPSTFATFEGLPAGRVALAVIPMTQAGEELDRVAVQGIEIFLGRTSRIVVDFLLQPPPPITPEEVCNGVDDDDDGLIDEGVEVLCGDCQADESVVAKADDPRCGEIPCDALDAYTISGDNSAAGFSECHEARYGPLTNDRCLDVGECREPHDATVCGPPTDALAASATLCQVIEGCAGAAPPRIVTVPDGTPCGPEEICKDGLCQPELPPPGDPVGCADGGREGFLDEATYPNIAACGGGWSEPGVRSTVAPTCARAAGDDGTNPNGVGCSVADLCATGWHVCADKEEVAAASPTGCEGAVAPGTPNNGVLFITRQRSTNNIVCEDRASAMGNNDVFGCGNLGPTLDPSKNCAPLNRALASQHDGSCDFNEAEPPLGPWRCGPSSLEESVHVVKDGPDKGGVLCCR